MVPTRPMPLKGANASALGQKQTFGPLKSMSALPPKADIGTQQRNVCFVPKAEIQLFDDRVGTSEHCRWYCEAQCLSGFKIDRQLVLGRRLHWQVGRLLAFEDAIDIAGCAPIPLGKIGPVGDWPAASDERGLGVDRRQSVASRELDEQSALNGRQCTRHHNQTAIARTRECLDGLLDLAGVAQVDNANIYPD